MLFSAIGHPDFSFIPLHTLRGCHRHNSLKFNRKMIIGCEKMYNFAVNTLTACNIDFTCLTPLSTDDIKQRLHNCLPTYSIHPETQ